MMVNVVVVVVVYSNFVVVDVGPRNTGSTWKLKAIMKLSICVIIFIVSKCKAKNLKLIS